MGKGIDLRTFFQETYSVNDVGMENIFDFINGSITVAALEKPKEFRARRSRIIEALLMASPLDGSDHDSEISSSSNTSCDSPDDQDQYEEWTSKRINLGAKDQKGCGRVKSVVDDEENKNEGKKFQRKIGTDDAKRKDDARSRNKVSGSGSDEVKFEATKRKFEEASLRAKKAKRTIQFVDFKDIPQPELAVDEKRCQRGFRGGFKNASLRRR
ncbi:Hypothetical predicted protein [Olea europaea subsp. europaea]|uniref:Uncharacterized protein n=1 Tax=Olea europaea subsp. europaea TaxID=158383 RepID=A0A8S0TGA8_OLEEU|nr:Hypothetical predicted protein [Olea europaea subsp. europaea]